MVTRIYKRKTNCLVCERELTCTRSSDGSYSMSCACAVTTYNAEQWKGGAFKLITILCDCGGEILPCVSPTSFFGMDYKCEKCGKPYYPGEAS